MNRQRPHFLHKYFSLIFFAVPSTIGFIADTIPGVSDIKFGIFSLNIFIALGLAIVIFIIHITSYIISLNKYCTTIENNNAGLTNDNSLIKEKNTKLQKELEESIRLNQAIIFHLQQGIIDITDNEKKYLKSILEIINNLSNKKGENNE